MPPSSRRVERGVSPPVAKSFVTDLQSLHLREVVTVPVVRAIRRDARIRGVLSHKTGSVKDGKP